MTNPHFGGIIGNGNKFILTRSRAVQMAAKERYLFFLKEYAGLEDVVSDRFLASFLDMSPETLSRQKRCLREEKPD